MQQDLFESRLTNQNTQNKMGFLERYRISLRLDQGIAAFIGLMVLFVLSFSFGVEKGKRMGINELKDERLKSERMLNTLRAQMFSQANRNIRAAAETQPIIHEQQIVNSEHSVAIDGPATQAEVVVQPETRTMPTGKFTIQSVTYVGSEDASREVKRLTTKGYNAFVIPSGKYHLVCVNGFDSRSEANQTLSKLKAQKLVPGDAYVRSLPTVGI